MMYIDPYKRTIVEPLRDSAIWVDIADPSTYTLDGGDVFTAFSNKGSKGGSFTINGSPTKVDDYFYHDDTTKWLRYDGTIVRPQTVFAVWQCMDVNTKIHALWGGRTVSDDNMESTRWGSVPSQTSNYFNNTGGNKLFSYAGENKGVIAMKIKPTALNVWENGVQILDDIAGSQSNVTTDLSAMSILDHRIGYNQSTGLVKLWEFGWYESNLSDAEITNKAKQLMNKHNLS